MDYEVDGTKIICPIEFTDKCTEKKQRCWTSDLRAVITPEGMCRCTYSRGGNKMPLPETIEEFVMYRNILNKESVSNKECLFCTRKKLNSMVDKLINDSDYIKKNKERILLVENIVRNIIRRRRLLELYLKNLY